MCLYDNNHFKDISCFNYAHFRDTEIPRTLQNALKEDLDILYHENAAQDDPRLVNLIRQYLLEAGSELPYNLTNDKRQDYSQGGQSAYVDALLDHTVSLSTAHKNLCGSRPFGPKEIDGLLVPPGKAHTLLTDHLITG